MESGTIEQTLPGLGGMTAQPELEIGRAIALAYARSRHMLLRIVHHILEIEHNDVCAGMCGLFQSCVVVSWDDQPRAAYSISHRLFLC